MRLLNVKQFALTVGFFGLFVAVTGIIWHGLLGQPSILNLIYADFWSSPLNWLLALAGAFLSGVVYGGAFAYIYNWALKRFG